MKILASTALILVAAYLLGYYILAGLFPSHEPSIVGLTIAAAAMPGWFVGLYAGRA